MAHTTVQDINHYVGSTVNPIRYPEQTYELYSVPSFDSGYPEIIKGADIGSSKVTVQENDILVCKINPRINRVWVVKHNTEFPLLASSEWIVIRSPENDAGYLKWYFSSGRFQKLMISQVTGIGGSLTRAQPKQVAAYPVPVRLLEEQKHIAAVLDRVEQLMSLQKQQLKRLDELVKARFVEMFGEFISTTKHFVLGDISEFVSVGIANSATHAYADTGVVMLRNQNIKENYLDDSDLIHIDPDFAALYKSKKLKENDILVIRTGYPGVACLVPAKYEGCQTFTTLIVRLKHSADYLPLYICHYINSQYGKAYVDEMKVGVAQQNFGAKALEKMPIAIPPIDKQLQFEAIVRQANKSKLTIRQGLDKLELLKKALMQKYFG